MDTKPPTMGRPRKPDDKKVRPFNTKLAPLLLSRLEKIRGEKTWPATLEMLADRWEGLR